MNLLFPLQIRELVVEYAEAKVQDVKERRGLADLQLTFLRGSIFGHPSLPVMGKFDRIHVGASCPKLRLKNLLQLLRLLKPGPTPSHTQHCLCWPHSIETTAIPGRQDPWRNTCSRFQLMEYASCRLLDCSNTSRMSCKASLRKVKHVAGT